MQNELYSPSVDLTVPVAQLVSANTVAGNPVQSGDACVIGDITGIATTSAGQIVGQPYPGYVASVTPSGFIALRTKGVFSLSVTPGSAVVFGQKIFIDPATGILSDNTAKTMFGWAMGPANAGVASTIPVKLKM